MSSCCIWTLTTASLWWMCHKLTSRWRFVALVIAPVCLASYLCSSDHIGLWSRDVFVLNTILSVQTFVDSVSCHWLLLIFYSITTVSASRSTVALPKRCPSTAWIPAVPSAFTPITRRISSLCVLLLVWWVFTPLAYYLTLGYKIPPLPCLEV